MQIKQHQLTNGARSPFFKGILKKEDLTRGLRFPGLRIAVIGTSKKVTVWYYEGKPDFYNDRQLAKYDGQVFKLISMYQKKLNITLLGLVKNGGNF